MDYSILKQRVKEKIENKCLLRNVNLPGKNGSRYSWMFYMRPGLFDPNFMLDVSQMFLYRCKQEIGHTDFQICGLETGAVPLVVGIPIVANLEKIKINAFSVRKKPKEYGLKNSLEGVPNKKKAVIVDDIVNSASSVRKCYDLITKEGIEFSGWVFSIIRKFNSTNHMPPETKYIHLFDVSEWGL